MSLISELQTSQNLINELRARLHAETERAEHAERRACVYKMQLKKERGIPGWFKRGIAFMLERQRDLERKRATAAESELARLQISEDKNFARCRDELEQARARVGELEKLLREVDDAITFDSEDEARASDYGLPIKVAVKVKTTLAALRTQPATEDRQSDELRARLDAETEARRIAEIRADTYRARALLMLRQTRAWRMEAGKTITSLKVHTMELVVGKLKDAEQRAEHAEAERDSAYEKLELVNQWFKQGVRAAEMDERGEPTPCPYPRETEADGSDAPPAHWWTRGYAYQVRIFRAVRAESELAQARQAYTAKCETVNYLSRMVSELVAERATARARVGELENFVNWLPEKFGYRFDRLGVGWGEIQERIKALEVLRTQPAPGQEGEKG